MTLSIVISKQLIAKWCVTLVVVLGLSCASLAGDEPAQSTPLATTRPKLSLTGWGDGKPDEIIPVAAQVGVDRVVVDCDPTIAARSIDLGKKHHVDIFAVVALNDVKRWKATRPGVAPPMQVMTEQQEAAVAPILADKTPGKSNYQFGGEPVRDSEVLLSPLLCFHDERVLAFFQERVDQLLSIPGLRGIALDYFGYRNYRCCHCPLSTQLAATYAKQHPELTEPQALERFSLDSLVEFNNKLIAHVRKTKPDAQVLTHIYPVFLPEPLYGNRLDVDECGQTAAWFFEPYWSNQKITEYSRIITTKQNQYFPRPVGAALIGCGLPPNKNPERIAAELDAIFAGGCTHVQVCDLSYVLRDQPTREVFTRYFSNR